jgi:nicotinamidase-related amidase
MPATALDPTTALVLIDLQKGVVVPDKAHPVDVVLAHAAQLASAFRERGLPVALVTVAGAPSGRTDLRVGGGGAMTPPPGFADLADELGRADEDLLVTKTSIGAFATTELDRLLRERGVTQIVLAGISTSVGVEATARHGYDLGYHVTVVSDASTDRSLEAHENSVARSLPRVAEVATTDEVLALLGR